MLIPWKAQHYHNDSSKKMHHLHNILPFACAYSPSPNQVQIFAVSEDLIGPDLGRGEKHWRGIIPPFPFLPPLTPTLEKRNSRPSSLQQSWTCSVVFASCFSTNFLLRGELSLSALHTDTMTFLRGWGCANKGRGVGQEKWAGVESEDSVQLELGFACLT